MRFYHLAAVLLITQVFPGLSAAQSPADESSSPTTLYSPKVGSRFVYETRGNFSLSGPVNRTEQGRFRSTFTALSQEPQGTTMLAEVDMLSQAGSNGAAEETTQPKAAARFTFILPPEGAVPGRTLDTAGLPMEIFSGWQFEYLFPPIPADGTTTRSMTLPTMGEEVPVRQVVTTTGALTHVKEVLDRTTAAPDSTIQQYLNEAIFSKTENVVTSASSAVAAALPFQTGDKAQLSLNFSSEQTSSTTLSESQLKELKTDVEMGIDAANKVRALSRMSGENALVVLNKMDEYLKAHPQGVFAGLYRDIKNSLTAMIQRQKNSEAIQEGKPAPDFEATTIDGKKIKLSDLKGKVVLLDFWATWCPPCVEAIPALVELNKAMEGKSFQMIGISADNERSELEEFVKEKNVTWPQIHPEDGDTSSPMSLYGIMKFPTTVLIDRQGVIQNVDLRGDQLKQAVEDLVDKPAGS